MPISIGQWHEEIGNFNSYKCKTSFKTEHNNFTVYLSLYKLIIIICLCYIHMISAEKLHFFCSLSFNLQVCSSIYDLC